MAKRDDKIDRVRDKLADLALDAQDGQFVLDAFKALSADRIGMKRASKGENDPEDNATTMEGLMKGIHAAERMNA